MKYTTKCRITMRCSEPGMTSWFAIHASRAPLSLSLGRYAALIEMEIENEQTN